MSYSADTFVADEQPTTAKWNKLWSNDASFNDGTGIGDDAIIARHISGFDKSNLTTDSNPYKFSAYKSGAQTVNTGSATQITFETEEFDTNNNFASSAYTAPVNGFYLFNGAIGNNAAASATRFVVDIFVDGAVAKRGIDRSVNAATGASAVVAMIQLTAAQVVDIRVTPVGANQAITVAQSTTYFQGFLISRT